MKRELTRRDFLKVAGVGAALAGGIGVPAVARGEQVQSNTTLSTTNRLKDRRYVAAGTRAYVVGTEDGRFPAMGFHTRGEMGGIWSPPLKLLDGIWFGIDEEWIGPAEKFTSGYGYVEMDLPDRGSLKIKRIDFVPDGRRTALFGLVFSSGSGEESFTLKVDAHSELMSAYPWGETTPSQKTFNLKDSVSYRDGRLVFREKGKPPVANAEAHDWAAVVGSSLQPSGHATEKNFRGPQDPPIICPPSPEPAPDRCDDTAYGKGAGGQLRYDIRVPANSTTTVWFAVTGSESGPAAALAENAAVLKDPGRLLREKITERVELGKNTILDLPGDRLLQNAIDWGKQNLADLTQEAQNLKIRRTHEGTKYPKPAGTVDRIRFIGAGFPDYPWLFATDGEYTAFALVGVGRFDVVKDHLRALREVSDIANSGSGKVVHEVVTDGSVYFGLNSDPGNTDETVKFPAAVALLWRWSGDNGFLDEMYPFAKKNLEYVFANLDKDGDLWPEGSGNVEAPGLGEEKLDVAVYTIRGLYDLADMARAKNDGRTYTWAVSRARRMVRKFERDWWMPNIPQHADSLDDPGNKKTQQRWWIGVTPMEAELHRNGEPVPGLTTSAHAKAALNLREKRCYSNGYGMYVQGAAGCDPAPPPATPNRIVFTLNTAVIAVGEGNYGRLGKGHQRRYTDDNAKLQLPNPDEQPGALPEIAPSPDYGRSINKPLNERAQVMQAWGNYGTIWPVVHQQLGVRPDMGRRRLEVTPQLPPGQSDISGSNIRLGSGYIDVIAEANSGTYLTSVKVEVSLRSLTLGHTISENEKVSYVILEGKRVGHRIRRTPRGQEVLVEASTSRGQHNLVVKTHR